MGARSEVVAANPHSAEGERSPSPASPIIRLENIGVSFPRRSRGRLSARRAHWALEDVSFDLYPGEVVGVVGRNGSGKSTLLRLLAGIIAPDRGRMLNSGVRASLLSLQVGFARHLSGRRNIVLSGLLLGVEMGVIASKIDEIIEFAELEEFIDDPISSYSSGMTARLGFAIAFQMDPEVLLIDEVLGVGDGAFAAKSSAMLRERIQSNKTVVLVSHNTKRTLELSDRVLWIDRGCVRAVGPAEDVVSDYETYLRSAGRPARSQAQVSVVP